MNTRGRVPTGRAATIWDAVSADATGVAAGPTGAPVLRVDAGGRFFDLEGNPVTDVSARQGSVTGYTTARGERVDL